MPKVTQAKIDQQVLLREVQPGTWRADWRDPLTKRRHRVVLPVSSFKEAQRKAKEISDELSAGRGFGGRLRGSVGHLVGDAVMEAIKHTDANERTRKDYWSRFTAFAEYLESNTPGIKAWSDVTPAVLENYIEASRKTGIAHDTLRQRVFVLRLAASYMTRTYGYRPIASGIKLRRHDPPKAELEAKEAILTPVQYRSLLAWLKENAPTIYAWAVLQGCGGLRLLEAAYLREQDIDPVAKTITITETSAHKPKNRHSYRCIPVCEAAIDALMTWIDGLKVRHNEGYLFLPSPAFHRPKTGKSAPARVGALTVVTISKWWNEALTRARMAKGKRVELSPAFSPRRLRASFVTAMREAGADMMVLQKYIGHAPMTILSANYDKVDVARLKEIAKLGQDLFEGRGAFVSTEEKAAENGSKK
jgi:integrase